MRRRRSRTSTRSPTGVRPRLRSRPRARFDRDFSSRITKKLGFFDGRPGRQWAINGGIYPDVPMFVVEKGDLVRITITNDTSVVHPMHLHGHHALVLSRNGQPATGSPWWTDTLNVDPGDKYVIAFRADNPGIWMDHCHNLGHAAAGLTMHVAYAGDHDAVPRRRRARQRTRVGPSSPTWARARSPARPPAHAPSAPASRPTRSRGSGPG